VSSPLDPRPAVRRITKQAERELWRLDLPVREMPAAVAEITSVHADVAAGVGAEIYELDRARVGVSAAYDVVLPERKWLHTEELVMWAYDRSLGHDTFIRLIAGGVERRIADAARRAVTENVARDPGARGWQRLAQSDGCAFCVMLAGRGAVYLKSTVTFSAHDSCRCAAVAAWEGKQATLKPFKPTERLDYESAYERARRWMAENAQHIETARTATVNG